jgi:YidC/Oxa1 family membrane protein insertase
MDAKRLILSVAIMMLIVTSWQFAVNYLYKTHANWRPPDIASTEPTTNPAAETAANTSEAVLPTSGSPDTTAVSAATTQPAILGATDHADPRYAIGLSIDPAGAGISSATLNDFYETAERKNPYVFERPLDGLESSTRPLTTQWIELNGTAVDLSNVNWTLATCDSASATYHTTINDHGKPTVEVDKTFTVPPRDIADGSGGFEITVSQNFKNLSDKPIQLKTAFAGPTLPPRESDRSEDRQFIAGYNDDQAVEMNHAGLTEYTKDKPSKDLVAIDKRPLLWVGTDSAYFNAIARPTSLTPPVKIAAAVVSGTNLDGPTDQRLASLSIQSDEFNLSPAAQTSIDLKVFLGPKKRDLLKNNYYINFPLSYDKTLVTSGGLCGFLTFQPLINLLYGILWFFHLIFHDWGVAIICLVLLVRTLLHPITKKSQVNMMQMSKMGPEIERLKKKHGDNKDELNKAMMEFYKTQGFTPILGCLPMFLQTPIWLALWSALQSTFDLRQATFLRFGSIHLTWIKDLSHPDALIAFSNPIPLLFGWTLHGINVLPMLLGVMFFIQQKMQPQPAAQTPEQQQQRKMMQWMSLLFPLMLYAGPSGLNLYILTSTSIGIVESKIIRDHIKQKEEEEKAGRVIVDAKPTRAGKRRDKNEPPKAEKKGRLMTWLADLQAKADQVRRDAERK